MNYLFINYYSVVLLSLSTICLFILVLGIFYLVKSLRKNKKTLSLSSSPNTHKLTTILQNDMAAIAGEDIDETRLDLARAYIETGKIHLAKAILTNVATQGSSALQKEARILLDLI